MTVQTSEGVVCLDPSRTDRLRALSARYYVDRDVLEREREQIFFRSWQYACHVSELDVPGAYLAFDVMGQNVFVVRSGDGEIRAFCNVCPHRGHKLLEGSGCKKVIVCPYHQWSYSLDGRLRHDRSTASSETPDTSRICLTPVRVDRLLDFVFVNLDPEALPIADFWPGLEAHVRSTIPDLDTYSLSPGASVLHPVDVRANWKIQVDNFLECYHCRIGHESFADMLEVANQRQSLHPNYSYVFIPSSGKPNNKAYPLVPEHDVMDLHFWHLFPNIALAQFSGPGNLSLSQWTPLGMDRAFRRIVQLDLAEPTDPGMLERRELRTAWGRDVLQYEDISFMESVHEGMSQRSFEHGWYMIDPDNEEISEVMLRHFHETYLRFLGEPDAI